MLSPRKFCILANPLAAGARAMKLLPKVEQALTSAHVDFKTVIASDIPHAKAIIRSATTLGECVVVFGGDGSIRTAAHQLVHSNGLLAILPAGRGNDFARMLNYPLNPVDSCHVLSRGQEKTIDIGVVNQHAFLTICTIGLDAAVNELANRIHFINGPAVYLFSGLFVLPRWKPKHFHLIIDGQEFEHFGHSVAIANGKYYGGGMKLAPDASISDGILDVILIGMISKYRLLLNLPRLYKGTHIAEEGVRIIRGRHIIIRATNELPVYADGDALSFTPAEISIRPAALRVLVPGPVSLP